MRERHDLLVKAVEELFDDGVLSRANLYLDDQELLRTVYAYYLLSEAYKRDKLGHEDTGELHWTEGSKKAALTTLAIMQFRPLRLLRPAELIDDEMTHAANQVLSLTLAGSFMSRDFAGLSWEDQRRIFNLLDRIGRRRGLRIRSLGRFIADQQARRYLFAYDIDVDRDMPLIDSLILLYESPLRP